ncbi:UNVERIFIED_CONTAM: hypothetical protein NCL1_18728 [Trichonephila clavipes]
MLLIRNYFYFQKANIESMDPILYSKYHHLQERDVNDFLLACASFSNWCNLTKKIVMDVGCGSGNTSCAWFLSLFLQVKRLIAIDKSEEMIKLAKSRSLEYPQIYSENSSDVYYKRLLQELGFTVVLCKKKQKTFAFSSDEDCIGFLLSVFSLYKMVPDECMEEFRNDLLESFLLYGGREASGRPVVYYNLMNVLVKRPNQTT